MHIEVRVNNIISSEGRNSEQISTLRICRKHICQKNEEVVILTIYGTTTGLPTLQFSLSVGWLRMLAYLFVQEMAVMSSFILDFTSYILKSRILHYYFGFTARTCYTNGVKKRAAANVNESLLLGSHFLPLCWQLFAES